MLAGSHRNAWPDETGTGGRTNRNTHGFFSAGDTYQDALVNAREAISLHLASLADMGLDSPSGLTADHYINNPEYQGWLWDVVEV